MSAPRLLFYTTLLLLVGFTFSSIRDLGVLVAFPWIVASWTLWALGVAYLRARHHRP